jgi:hypothetical protein
MHFYAVYIGYTKSVASISNHVKIGSVTCLFWLPLLENRGSQNSSEQSCDCLPFQSISVPKIRSTPNSKWSSLRRLFKHCRPSLSTIDIYGVDAVALLRVNIRAILPYILAIGDLYLQMNRFKSLRAYL